MSGRTSSRNQNGMASQRNNQNQPNNNAEFINNRQFYDFCTKASKMVVFCIIACVGLCLITYIIVT